MLKGGIALVVGACGLFATARASATVLDANFTESVYANVGNGVTGIAWAPDASSRLFATVKTGTVRIIKDGTLLPTAFVTIDPVYTNSECGVIGMAFDPAFSENGYVYFFVTVSASEQQIIRYTANGDVGTDKTVIVSGLPTLGQNHDGGGLGFGPDGKLYWAIGDLGNRTGVGANLSLLAAKIGRVNADGSLPGDNPFADGAGPNEDRIWARGFRNPFTLTFQPSTERLWVNVVGTSYEQVFLPQRRDHAGYNDYENNQPVGYLAPVIAYRTNGTDTRNITSAVRSGGITTFTTATASRFRSGTSVTISGSSDATFDGSGYVTFAADNEFRVAQAGPDGTATGGSVVTAEIGGCITGGAFWDSTAPGAEYRGNFFFGDFNSGRIERVTLDEQNAITSVQHFATGIGSVTDVDSGPDGALYYSRHGGQIVRTAFNATAQDLVVSRRHLRGAERGAVFFQVRLAEAPLADVPVVIARTAGDTDVSVEAGGALTFTSENWSVPQATQVRLGEDADAVDDAATVTVSSSGLDSVDVTVRTTDEDTFGIVLSPSALMLDEGGTESFEVSLTGAPPSPVTVELVRESGSATVRVESGTPLSFSDADWQTPQVVTLVADDDANGNDEQTILRLSGTGLTTTELVVDVTDDDATAPEITGTPNLTAVQGAPYTYAAVATGLPEPSFSLDEAPNGMSVDPETGVVSWTPAGAGFFDVTLRAENGVAPDDTQSFSIEVLPDAAPSCTLTAPNEGSVLTGEFTEFFGDVDDDVGATHATFSVDGVVRYDDRNDEGHYHFLGAHALFDTTQLTNGPHVLRMTGYDTGGQTCVVDVNVTIDNPEPTDAGLPQGGSGSGGGSGAAGAGGVPSDAGMGIAGNPGAAGTGGGAAGGAPTDVLDAGDEEHDAGGSEGGAASTNGGAGGNGSGAAGSAGTTNGEGGDGPGGTSGGSGGEASGGTVDGTGGDDSSPAGASTAGGRSFADAGVEGPTTNASGDCNCRTPGERGTPGAGIVALLGLALAALRRRARITRG